MKRYVLVTAAFISSAVPAAANVCEDEMGRASARYGVPLGVLYAVGLTETGRRGFAAALCHEHRRDRLFRHGAAGRHGPLHGGAQQGRAPDRSRLHADQPPFSRQQVQLGRGDDRPARERAIRHAIPAGTEEAGGQLGPWRWPATMPGRTTMRHRSSISAGSSPTWSRRDSVNGPRRRRNSAGDAPCAAE